MIKKLQILLLAIAGTTIANAQDLSQCKNICDKQRIIESGPFIGIRFNVNTVEKTATVLEVIPNTAAQRNNLAVGDVLLQFENTPIISNVALIKMVAAHKPGDVVSIMYKHNGVVNTKNIALGALQTKTITVQECCDDVVTNTTAQLMITPNPAQNSFTLKSNIRIAGDLTISIYDNKGGLVKSMKHKNDGLLSLPIDVTDYANGTYFVRVFSKTQQYSEKLIISK
ncbi:MAG: hypothetical protein RL660_2620 [Bacteroidota bacterium]|jgi:hypothetical protein